MRVISTFLAAGLMLAGCSSGPLDANAREPAAQGQAAPVHPTSGLPVIDLAVKSGKTQHPFRVEVARSAEEQAKGLMFRTEMGADEGMLFVRNPPDLASFWMKNTVIPLDIIYVGVDGRILNIVDAKPYDLTPLPSKGVAAAVLELNGGRAAQLGIKVGDKVSWKLPNRAQ